MKHCEKILVISTVHLSKETAALLNGPTETWPCSGGHYHEYGWFVYASEDNSMPDAMSLRFIPDDLFDVMTFARTQKAFYVLFDRDAPEHPELPTFTQEDDV